MDSIKDSTRYLVNKEHFGNIMPGNRAEMLRNVYLQSGAKIKGGIYGNEIAINGGDVVVEGTVYSKTHIKFSLDQNASKAVTFKSTVVCPGTILVPSNENKVRFLSDIYTQKLKLNQCIVYGNVYATSAILEDCIVLGGVYCTKDLKLKNSVVFTFRAEKCELKNDVSILSPFCFAQNITLQSTVNVLMFHNLFKEDTDEKAGAVVLDESDIYEEKGGNTEDENSSVNTIQVLSVAERLLNTSEIIQQFAQNKKYIEFLSLNSHLSEEDKKSFELNNEKEIEQKLWKIITNTSTVKVLAGTRSLKEMFEQFA